MALFALCGLLCLHMLPGFGSSIYGYGIDACIAVLLLAFGDQILLTSLFFFIQASQQLNRFIRLINPYRLRSSLYLPVSAHPKKIQQKGVNLSPLLTGAMLIIAGTLSPSDGVDSGRYLPTGELLWRTFLILVSGVGCFLFYILWHRDKPANDEIVESKPKTVANTADDHSRFLDVVE
jgi:hypothetical protein